MLPTRYASEGSLKRVGMNARPTRIGVSDGSAVWRVSGCLALHGGGEECVCAVFGGIRLQIDSRVQRDFLCAQDLGGIEQFKVGVVLQKAFYLGFVFFGQDAACGVNQPPACFDQCGGGLQNTLLQGDELGEGFGRLAVS